MGTSLTAEQVKLLGKLRCEIRLCLDGDQPGQVAMMKNSRLLAKEGIPHRIVDYQGDLRDPDDIFNDEGKEGLLKRLNKLLEPTDFYLGFYQSSAEGRTQEQRKAILDAFLPYLKAQKAGIEYEDALQKLSKATGYQADAIRAIAQSSQEDETMETASLITKRAAPQTKHLGRLKMAEKSLLYYMLKDPRAIEIYQTRVGAFYDDTYREAANYILDYARSHPGEQIEVSAICSNSIMDGREEVSNSISDLALERTHEDPTEDLLVRYAKTIVDAKKQQISKQEIQHSLAEGDSQALAVSIQAYLDERRKALKK